MLQACHMPDTFTYIVLLNTQNHPYKERQYPRLYHRRGEWGPESFGAQTHTETAQLEFRPNVPEAEACACSTAQGILRSVFSLIDLNM